LVRQDEHSALISVRDNGGKLPAGFDLGKSKGLGMRIVARLSEHLQAAITYRSDLDGTEFALTFPLRQ
jgi:two-component system, sensor histidine kinase PdtaS